MMAWYVVELSRYGKLALALSRLNVTVRSSVFVTPVGLRTPLNADSACDPVSGLTRRLNVAMTSSAVIAWPFWNLTPDLSLTVQVEASALGVQLVASSGTSFKLAVARIKNSPQTLPVSSAPCSAKVCGSIVCTGGGMIPRRRRPPCFGPVVVVDDGPQPAMASTPPIADADKPKIVARLMNSRRSYLTSKNSSRSVRCMGPRRLISSNRLRSSGSIGGDANTQRLPVKVGGG